MTTDGFDWLLFYRGEVETVEPCAAGWCQASGVLLHPGNSDRRTYCVEHYRGVVRELLTAQNDELVQLRQKLADAEHAAALAGTYKIERDHYKLAASRVAGDRQPSDALVQARLDLQASQAMQAALSNEVKRLQAVLGSISGPDYAHVRLTELAQLRRDLGNVFETIKHWQQRQS